MSENYVHGEQDSERDRLRQLNELTNGPFLDFLGLEAGSRVLEVGSGLGILAEQASHRVSPGFVTGIERSNAQITEAIKLCKEDLLFLRADANFLPFKDGSFDTVYCRYVLEHLNRPSEALLEISRVLKPGGRFLVQENDTLLTAFDPDCPSVDFVIRQFVRYQACLGGDGRIGKRLYGLLVNAGFRQVRLSLQPEIHTASMDSFPVWVNNIIGIIRGARSGICEAGLAMEGDIDAAVVELQSLLCKPDASALFHWNRACGIK